jgi:MFS family permease
MVVNLGAAALAQQGLRLAPPGDLTLFAMAALLVSIGLLPVALTRSEQPPIPHTVRLKLRALVALSPMGTVGCFLSGMITSPFWVLGPVYAQRLGHDLASTTLFMSLVVVGGTVMQWPLGWLSDRIDRRLVLIGVFAAVALISGVLSATLGLQLHLWLALAAAFGGAAFCINAICVSHVNDIMIEGDRIGVSANLLMLFGAGAIAGPMLAGFVMAELGPGGMFGQIAVTALIGMLFAMFRRHVSAAPPDAQKEPFVAVPRTTPAAIPLDPRVPAAEAGFDPVTGEHLPPAEDDPEEHEPTFGDRGS